MSDDDSFDSLAAQVNEVFDSPGSLARFRVFMSLNTETVKRCPGLAWQVIDMQYTRTVANCFQENEANHIAYLLNIDAEGGLV